MNANQIITMIFRMVSRRLVGRAVNKGIDMAASRGGGDGHDTRVNVKRARQAMKMARRIGR